MLAVCLRGVFRAGLGLGEGCEGKGVLLQQGDKGDDVDQAHRARLSAAAYINRVVFAPVSQFISHNGVRAPRHTPATPFLCTLKHHAPIVPVACHRWAFVSRSLRMTPFHDQNT